MMDTTTILADIAGIIDEEARELALHVWHDHGYHWESAFVNESSLEDCHEEHDQYHAEGQDHGKCPNCGGDCLAGKCVHED